MQGALAQEECLRITAPRSPMSVRRDLSCVFMSKEAKFAMASRLCLRAEHLRDAGEVSAAKVSMRMWV